MGKRQTGFSKETLKIIGKHFAALVDYAKDKENLTAKQVYQQIYGDDDISNIEDKISKMKRGESITAYDVMKIQAWKNLSLDWLILGKGNPPPELQKEIGTAEKAQEEEKESPADTVRGLLSSLMFLSLARYTRNMKIETHSHDYFYHDITISFSFVPFDTDSLAYEYDEDGDYYSLPLDPYATVRKFCLLNKDQCDTVSFLVQGLRALSSSTIELFKMPTNDSIMLKARIDKYNQILDSIPPNQSLGDYKCECHKQLIPLQSLERYFPNNFLPWCITKRNIFIPEKY